MAALAASGAEIVLLERQAPQNLTEALEVAGYTCVKIDTLMTHPADGDAAAYEQIMLTNTKAVAAAFDQVR